MAVVRTLLQRQLELLSDKASLQQQVNRLAEKNPFLAQRYEMKNIVDVVKKKLDSILFIAFSDKKYTQFILSKTKLPLPNTAPLRITQVASETEVLRDKIRFMEVAFESIKVGTLERPKKQAEVYAARVFQVNVGEKIPAEEMPDSKFSSIVSDCSLQLVDFGEEGGGKDGWIGDCFQVEGDDSDGSIAAENFPENTDESSETTSTLTASPKPPDPEPVLIAIEEVDVIESGRCDVVPSHIPEMSQELINVSVPNVQPVTRGTQTEERIQDRVPAAQEEDSHTTVRVIRFSGIPHRFSSNELSALVRGGKLEKIVVLDGVQSTRAAAIVQFTHSRDALRFFSWSQQMDLYVGSKKVYADLSYCPPLSGRLLKAVDSGASRVLIFEKMPAKLTLKSKESFISMLRKKVFKNERRPYGEKLEIELESGYVRGSLRITAMFGNLKQSVTVQKELSHENWGVRFGRDPCEGAVEELLSWRTGYRRRFGARCI
ncbi:hypothetical protein RUND412_000010 [Rhizina undulata]